jgi:two-component system chemotaxis response regulator CheB
MRVLVVDDSIVFRTAIKAALLNSDDITEVDAVANGRIAVQKLQKNHYDGITLDLEMSVMEGQETIIEIRKFNKEIPIIVFSAVSLQAATKTFKALELGANDFVQKLQNSTDVNENLKMIENEVVPRFRALTQFRIKPVVAKVEKEYKKNDLINFFKADLICIGSSTGGPDALKTLFKKIGKLNVPMLLVQHMPPIFTTQLAAGLDKVCEIEVKEAKNGDFLKPGVCYLAPGDFHMRILRTQDNEYRIGLNQGEKVCCVRPAVDVMMNSVAECFEGKVGSFILTGMGNDGANGCVELKEKNDRNLVVIQDEASSIVWGMPKAVFDAKAYDDIETLDNIAKLINKIGIR